MTEAFSFSLSVPKALAVQPVPNAMLRQLRLQPKHLVNPSFLSIRCLSSSSSSPPPPQPDPASASDPPPDSAVGGRSAPPSPSISSYFSDIRDRLKSPPSPPPRIPINPPPLSASSASARPASDTSYEEVRMHLAEFQLKSGGPSSGKPPPSDFALSFKDRFNNKATGIHRASSERTAPPSLDAIRENLKKTRDSPGRVEGTARSSAFNINAFQDGLRKGPQPIGTDKLPDSIFGREKKVRDEFKKSENDCGSAQAQVAHLTTKIRHLSAVLHKKDKHSRKGLIGMIQLRKKLLKYLRRTDWDSYCIVLAKLGLRDVPDYKIASYKT